MDLLRPGLAQEVDYAGYRRAADYRVVDEYHALIAHGGGDDVELYPHGVLAAGLPGLDEGAADVLVLDEADAVGDAALLRVAEGGVEAGVGDADDDVRLHGVLEREEGARPLARRVDAAAVNHGVGAREVDELEDALGRLPAAVAAVGLYAVAGDGHYLAGLDVAQELRAYGVEGAALAGYGPAVGRLRLCRAGGSPWGRARR